ncbi:MAG: NHLP leader peptide family RiPP precursor [Bacteroidota bacterium]
MSKSSDRASVEAQLIKKAVRDDNFRTALLENPKATIEKEFGMQLPADVEVNIYPEKKNTISIVLPYFEGANADLQDEELIGEMPCSGILSFADCTLECTQCANNYTTCDPGTTDGE